MPSQKRVASCRAGIAGMQAGQGDVDSTLRGCRRSLALLLEIHEEAANAHHRFLRAEGYEYLGYAYEALAAAPPASIGEKREHMATSRDMFRQSMDVLDKLRARGGLDTASEEWAKQIGDEIAKCDEALKE